MLKLFRTNRDKAAHDHQAAVNDRVRGLTSVAHQVVDDESAHEIRSRLKGGRSELARPTQPQSVTN